MEIFYIFALIFITMLLYNIAYNIGNIAYDVRRMREITQNITEDNIHYIREYFKQNKKEK